MGVPKAMASLLMLTFALLAHAAEDAQQKNMMRAGMFANMMDKDKDGLLSFQELSSMKNDRFMKDTWEFFEAGFEEADADQDGKLDQKEMAALIKYKDDG